MLVCLKTTKEKVLLLKLGGTKKLKIFWFNITIPGAKAPCSTRPKTPQACRSCQFHRLVATCQQVPSQQVPTNLSISSSCNLSLANLLQLVETIDIFFITSLSLPKLSLTRLFMIICRYIQQILNISGMENPELLLSKGLNGM